MQIISNGLIFIDYLRNLICRETLAISGGLNMEIKELDNEIDYFEKRNDGVPKVL